MPGKRKDGYPMCPTVQMICRTGQTMSMQLRSQAAQGGRVKHAGICLLLMLLAVVAYTGLTDALSSTGKSSPGVPPSPAAVRQAVPALVMAEALAVASRRAAPEPPAMDVPSAADLSEYVLWHRTRNDRVSEPKSGAGSCPE